MAISGSHSTDQLLANLQNAITGLSLTVPEGTEDSPLVTHLCDFDVDEEEGPFYSFNHSWEQAFQHNDDEKKKLINSSVRVLTLQKTAVTSKAAAGSVQTQLAKGAQNKGTTSSKKLILMIKRPRQEDSDKDDHDHQPPKNHLTSDINDSTDEDVLGKEQAAKKKRTMTKDGDTSVDEDVEDVKVKSGRAPTK
ncbi:hypothetical protein EV702DRAFT_1041989 [Suillus placidus]|uniref:Uncharacterized protein n=1 Tax=Suillus placidus TaxID=48579 RepID=A0A9P7A2X1_9AGAM|nr:hypothetical protein EV702DRAFT_1041989 [Suillus placidus]